MFKQGEFSNKEKINAVSGCFFQQTLHQKVSWFLSREKLLFVEASI